MDFSINNTNWPGFAGTAAYGTYSGNAPTGGSAATSSTGGTTLVRTTANNTRNSCSVYCHANWPGSNGSLNPSWIGGANQAACGTCHGANASQAPTTGKHTTHASNSAGNYGFSCTKCHPNARSGSNTNFGHLDGNVQWRLSSATNGLIESTARYTPNGGTAAISGSTSKAAPSNAYGACSNVYCHSDVKQQQVSVVPPHIKLLIGAMPPWVAVDATATCPVPREPETTSSTRTRTGFLVVPAMAMVIPAVLLLPPHTSTVPLI